MDWSTENILEFDEDTFEDAYDELPDATTGDKHANLKNTISQSLHNVAEQIFAAENNLANR